MTILESTVKIICTCFENNQVSYLMTSEEYDNGNYNIELLNNSIEKIYKKIESLVPENER